MSLNERIAELCKRHGSIRAVARLFNCDHAYLWRLYKGVKSNPSKALLRKMGLREVRRVYERTK